jgi:hypothetical protein
MDVNISFANGGIDAAAYESGVGFLTVSRPEKRNALTDAMWRSVPDAINWLVAEQNVRVVILSGAGGRDFSAGADIGEFATLRKDATHGARIRGRQLGRVRCGTPLSGARYRIGAGHLFWRWFRPCRGGRFEAGRPYRPFRHSRGPSWPRLPAGRRAGSRQGIGRSAGASGALFNSRAICRSSPGLRMPSEIERAQPARHRCADPCHLYCRGSAPFRSRLKGRDRGSAKQP